MYFFMGNVYRKSLGQPFCETAATSEGPARPKSEQFVFSESHLEEQAGATAACAECPVNTACSHLQLKSPQLIHRNHKETFW